jgi:SSS family solute:Na+ symporter
MQFWEVFAIAVYVIMVVYLGYLGWKPTKTASDYMLVGRKAHPVIMALSYGATFISTSAIIGFGGVAACSA